METNKSLFSSIFGDSSDEEESKGSITNVSHFSRKYNWNQVSGISGLWVCSNFLSLEQQNFLLSSVASEGWLSDASYNQAMQFGDLQSWACDVSNLIRQAILQDEFCSELDDGLDSGICPLTAPILWREPLFDQLIMNVYQPGEGICSHVDLLRFQDGIAIISLESSCVMHFSKVESETDNSENKGELESLCCNQKIPVLLDPGSLVIMSGEARYFWRHGIDRRPGFQIWNGQMLGQSRRTSITLRKLAKSI